MHLFHHLLSTAFVVGAVAASVGSIRNDSVSEKDKIRYGINFFDYYGTKLCNDFCCYSDCAYSTFYFNPSNYDGKFGESGTLKRYLRRIKSAVGVHHFLLIDIPNCYIVFEWMDDSRAHFWDKKSLRKENGICTTYQTEKIKDVWNVVKMFL